MCYGKVTRGSTTVVLACVFLSFAVAKARADGYADYYGNGMAYITYEPTYYSAYVGEPCTPGVRGVTYTSSSLALGHRVIQVGGAYGTRPTTVVYSRGYREPIGSMSVMYRGPRHQYRSIRPFRTEHRRHYYRLPQRGQRPRYYYRDRGHDWSRDHVRPLWGQRRPQYRWQPHHGRRHSQRLVGSRQRWPGHQRHRGGFSIRIGR